MGKLTCGAFVALAFVGAACSGGTLTTKVVDALDEEIKELPNIKKMQEELDELIAAEKDNKDYSTAKLDLKLSKSEWQRISGTVTRRSSS